MTIEVIIPNYNGSHLIEKNVPLVIKAIRKYRGSITIVDDCSEKEDYLKLQRIVATISDTEKVRINLLRNTKNLGFSKTINSGSLKSESDLLVLLNSDVAPEKDFLDSVIPRFEKNNNLFAVGCMDRSVEGQRIVLRGRGVGSFHRGFVMHRKGDVNHDKTLWVSGGSSVIRTSIFKKLGGMDEIFSPFYWEDIDLSYRAIKAGYDIIFDNQSVVEHRHEEGAIKKHFSQQYIKTIAYRNQILFVWKNITDTSFLLEHILYIPYHLVRALTSSDLSFVTGLFSAFTKIPDVIRKRSKYKRLYKLRDREVLAITDTYEEK